MAKVTWGVEGAVRTVLLNRPDKRNALDAEMIAELQAAFTQAARRRGAACRDPRGGTGVLRRPRYEGAIRKADGRLAHRGDAARDRGLSAARCRGRAGRCHCRRQRAGPALRSGRGQQGRALRHVACPDRPGAELVPGQEAAGGGGAGDHAPHPAAGRSAARRAPLRAGRHLAHRRARRARAPSPAPSSSASPTMRRCRSRP